MPPPRSNVEDSDPHKTSSTTLPETSCSQSSEQTVNFDDEATHTREGAATVFPIETTDSPSTDNLQAGATVGRYIILARIGSGSMGVVYSAFDPGLDRRIALKLVKGTPSRKKATEHARLLREAKALARLNHANVVTIHEAGEVDGILYLAMEYIDGQSLGRWQKSIKANNRRSWREIVNVYVQAGQGLAAAHRAQLIHRDFKPDNVMVDSSGKVCVLDFGIAYPMVRVKSGDRDRSRENLAAFRTKESSTWTSPSESSGTTGRSHCLPNEEFGPKSFLGDSTGTDPRLTEYSKAKEKEPISENAVALTRIGSVIGTPAYMAPEQLYGRSANAKSDQFSFCVALYEALYGRRPFKGNTPAVLAGQVNTGTVLFPSNERGIPRRLRNLLARGLSVDPNLRFESMDALIDELRKTQNTNRRIFAITCGISLVIAGGAIGYNWTDHKIVACRDAESELEVVWNQSQRDKISNHFTHINGDAGPSSLSTVNKQLDDYANRWLSIHQDTCQNVHEAGFHGLENQSLKLACLSRRLRSFSALIRRLLHADPNKIEHLWSMSEELLALESCNSVRIENLGSTPPSDTRSLQKIEELELELAELSNFVIAEQSEEALDRAKRLVEGAQKLQFLPLIARSEITLARFHHQNQDFAEAEQEFRVALRHAEASGDGRTTLLAWLGMMTWFVEPQLDIDSAIEASQHIRALIERFDLQEHPENAQFSHLLGKTHHLAGRYDMALESFEQAMKIYRSHSGTASLRQRWDITICMGYTYLAQGNGKLALELLSELLITVQKILGELHPEVARVRNAVGRVYDSMDRDILAMNYYRSAYQIVVDARGQQHMLSAEILENFAGISLKAANYKLAIEQFHEALTIYQNLHSSSIHPDILRSYLNLGVVTYEDRQFEDSIHWCKLALDGFQIVYGERNLHIADALGCRAGGFDLVGQHQEALDDYNQALAILTEVLGDQHNRVAVTLEYLGETQWDHHEFRNALDSFRKSRAIWQNILPKDNPDRIYSEVFVEIIENYISQKVMSPSEINSIAKKIEWVYRKRPVEIIHDRLLAALEELKKKPSKRLLSASQFPQLPMDHH